MTALVIDSAASRATAVRLTEDALVVDLADGRTVSVPLAWYPRLLHGSTVERVNHRFIGEGEGIHWPDLDEDVSVENILAGKVSGEGSKSFQRWLEARASRAESTPKVNPPRLARRWKRKWCSSFGGVLSNFCGAPRFNNNAADSGNAALFNLLPHTRLRMGPVTELGQSPWLVGGAAPESN